jgi:hypothetical protein
MDAMDVVRAADETVAAELGQLLALGFSSEEAERLIRVKRQRERRPPDGLSEKRLLFARWLVEHGRLSDGPPTCPPDARCGPTENAYAPRDTPWDP